LSRAANITRGVTMIGATWGTGQVLLDMLWFFLFLIEIWLMISIFIDIFRRHDMRGWVKAFWIVLVILFPLIGIVLYLIIYGNEMRVHALQAAVDNDASLRTSGRGASSVVDDLARLAEFKERGIITDEEFERMKAKLIDA
jgi:uncharacterized protein with PQ loop repeat